MTLVASPVRHMGTDRACDILKRMRDDLEPQRRRCAPAAAWSASSRTPTRAVRVTGVTCDDGTG